MMDYAWETCSEFEFQHPAPPPRFSEKRALRILADVDRHGVITKDVALFFRNQGCSVGVYEHLLKDAIRFQLSLQRDGIT
jgi:hypothetical protein